MRKARKPADQTGNKKARKGQNPLAKQMPAFKVMSAIRKITEKMMDQSSNDVINKQMQILRDLADINYLSHSLPCQSIAWAIPPHHCRALLTIYTKLTMNKEIVPIIISRRICAHLYSSSQSEQQQQGVKVIGEFVEIGCLALEMCGEGIVRQVWRQELSKVSKWCQVTKGHEFSSISAEIQSVLQE